MQIETAAAPVNQKIVTVTKQEADILHQEAKQFQAEFQKQKEQFAHSQDSVYYIVSSKFLSQWRDFATAHTLQRYLPAPMNVEILENNKLKIELKQGEDFQILSQKLFKKFAKYEGISIKRKAVMVGNQKRIPIYLKEFRYVIITHEHLRAIDRNAISADKLQITPIDAAQQSTVSDLLQQIRAKERYSYSKKLRLWKMGNTSIQQVWQQIKTEAKKKNSYEIKITFLGKKIDDQKTKLNDLQFEENQFIVVEVVDQMKKWHLLSGGEGKCEGCYNMAQLKFPCGCKKVTYCSQQCKQKDKRFHLRNCEYALMEQENKLIEMRLTETSSRGRVGLTNLGNTCFMNSCLQCLSNTVPLTDYFIGGFFEKQINKVNPIGTKGKLAKAYAKFIKAMWCDSNTVFSPYNIKSEVSRINPMFSGYGQHDSQEFFSFLVDGLHQDLNRIEKKPFVESVDSNGRPDSVVALESWIAHIKRNQSIIVDLMTGQYRSKVTCPDCHKESITFDPFITVTLPIPQRVINSIMFYLIYPNMYKKTQRYYFTYQRLRAEDWIESASKLLDMHPSKFGMYVVTLSQGLYKVGRQPISQILHKLQSEGKQMFLVEYNDEDIQLQNPIQLPVRFAKKLSYDFSNLWFKFPFIFNKNSIKGIEIYRKILKFLYGKAYINNQDSEKPITYSQYQTDMLQKRPFKIFLKYNKKLQRTYHKLEFTYEDEQQIADDIDVAEFIQKQPVGDCQIDVRFFNRSYLDYFDFDCLKDYIEKMKKPQTRSSEQVTVSIDQCFQHFREVQRLQKGNQWYCSACKQHKQANKELGIYKAPKILILHLKRFKQKGTLRKEKNQSKVDFPMQLNMKEYLNDPKPMSSYVQEAKKQGFYVEPKTTEPVIASQQPVYELFAVSNHYGGLGGGHYTAYAKNNGKWFEFNDSSVRPCHQSYITGSGAYILFYKRKQ